MKKPFGYFGWVLLHVFNTVYALPSHPVSENIQQMAQAFSNNTLSLTKVRKPIINADPLLKCCMRGMIPVNTGIPA
jgi:hypothetical protein